MVCALCLSDIRRYWINMFVKIIRKSNWKNLNRFLQRRLECKYGTENIDGVWFSLNIPNWYICNSICWHSYSLLWTCIIYKRIEALYLWLLYDSQWCKLIHDVVKLERIYIWCMLFETGGAFTRQILSFAAVEFELHTSQGACARAPQKLAWAIAVTNGVC